MKTQQSTNQLLMDNDTFLEKEWLELVYELQKSQISKEKFKEFLEVKKLGIETP